MKREPRPGMASLACCRVGHVAHPWVLVLVWRNASSMTNDLVLSEDLYAKAAKLKETWYRFAIGILDGLPISDAYLGAFPKCTNLGSARRSGHKLIRKPAIAEFLSLARRETATNDLLSHHEKRRILAKAVRGHLHDMLDTDGNVTPEYGSLVHKYKQTYNENTGETKIEVEFLSTRDAIALDNAMAGPEPDTNEVTIQAIAEKIEPTLELPDGG